jgi:chemotaxis protein MotA
VLIISFMKGSAPVLAVEFGRRAIPGHLRPSFQETEKIYPRKSHRSRRGGRGIASS